MKKRGIIWAQQLSVTPQTADFIRRGTCRQVRVPVTAASTKISKAVWELLCAPEKWRSLPNDAIAATITHEGRTKPILLRSIVPPKNLLWMNDKTASAPALRCRAPALWVTHVTPSTILGVWEWLIEFQPIKLSVDEALRCASNGTLHHFLPAV